MSDLKVDSKIQTNNLNNVNSAKTSNQVSESKPETEDKKLSKSAKYMIGASALAATIALGVIGHKNNWWRKTARDGQDIVKNTCEMTLKAFNDAENKFEKGTAKFSNGKLFSGKLTSKMKDGKDLILEYESGKLTSAQKLDGGKRSYSKTYTYDEDGVLTNIWRGHFDASQNTYINEQIYMHNPYYIRDKGIIVKNISGNQLIQNAKTGKILRNRGKDYFYNPDGGLNHTEDAAAVLPDRKILLPE